MSPCRVSSHVLYEHCEWHETEMANLTYPLMRSLKELQPWYTVGSVGILLVYSICLISYIMPSYSLCGQIMMKCYVDWYDYTPVVIYFSRIIACMCNFLKHVCSSIVVYRNLVACMYVYPSVVLFSGIEFATRARHLLKLKRVKIFYILKFASWSLPYIFSLYTL